MVDRHPTEDDLFLLADGGFGPVKTWLLRLHLKRCWSCRRLVDEHRRAMHAVVAYQDRTRRAAVPQDLAMGSRFAQRLDAIAPEPPAHVARRLWIPTAAGAVCVTALTLVLLWRTPAVSADSLLDRAMASEAAAGQAFAAPVIRQELRLRRGENAPTTVVVWTDLASAQRRDRGGSPDWERYRAILARNRLTGQEGSLAAAHREWRSHIRRKQESLVQQDGFTLLSTEANGPFEPEAIARMDLEVRDQDWRALRQRMYVETGTALEQFEVEEVAESVVARAAVPAEVFGGPRPGETGSKSAEPAPHLTAAPGQVPAPQLTSAEVQVWLTLHRLNDCLGAQLEVERRQHEIAIRGQLPDPERNRALASAIRKIPFARLEPGELGAPTEALALPPGPASASTPNDWLAPLQNLKLSSARATELINAVVPLSGAALDQVWALRRIADRFNDSVLGSLTASDRAAIEQIFRDHRDALASGLAQISQTLGPILPRVPPMAAIGRPWTSAVRADFDAVQSLDQSVAGLLAPVAPSDANPDPILRAASTALQNAILLTNELPRAFRTTPAQ